MYLTATEYESLTHEPAPDDFEACAALACGMIDSHTLHAYAGRDLGALPDTVRHSLKLATALQAMAISQAGGLAGACETAASGMSLGKYSYSGAACGSVAALSPAVVTLMPMLVGYGRGLMA